MGISGTDQALMYARSGVIRSGASRSDYYQPIVSLTIAGTDRSSLVLRKTLEIEQVINEQPDTMTLTVRGASGFTPARYQEVVLGLGSITNRLFAGHILNVETIIARSGQTRPRYVLHCVDYTWLLNHKRVYGKQWTSTSISTIVTDLMSAFASLFTVVNVEASLPSVSFQANHGETLGQALTRLAHMMEPVGQWYVDYDKDLHFFQTPETTNNPIQLDDTIRTFWNLRYSSDGSQTRNRTYTHGQTTSTTAAVAVGSTTIPVEDTRIFGASGGTALSAGNKITYMGRSVSSGPGNLTGVPSSGTGSVLYAIPQGESVRVMESADDATAQTAMATSLGAGDGVIEHVVEDGNTGSPAALTRSTADVGEFSGGETYLRYTTRDKFARVGKTASVNISNPAISGSFVIQRTIIRGFTKGQDGTKATRFPIREIEAGGHGWDLLDILRKPAQE